MRLNFSTSWIFQGWITAVLVSLNTQDVISNPLHCDESHYAKGLRCCKKCRPGFRVFAECNDTHQTKCIKCNRGEYQPGWTEEKHCLLQKFCDPVKGFMERPENLVAEEPCRCLPHLQCYPINCEFCEKVPSCSAGNGLEVEPGSTSGRKICVACEKGFFSADNNGEHCKQWTNCKAEGRIETQPGSAQADAVCGQPVSGAAPSWVIVSVLSVITVLCLLILLLFCYKDKLKLLSVNLRSCVQNLKRTRIQQETLAPLYHSGGPKCTPCETTKLICQAPLSPTDESPCTYPTSSPEVKVSLPFAGETAETQSDESQTVTEDRSEGSGEPEEVSEEEEEAASVPPLLAVSCVCVVPIREPLEVGENEDCSQAVGPSAPATCSCGGLDGDESAGAGDGGEKADGTREKALLCKGEAGAAPLVSLSPPLLHTSSAAPPSSPLPELCLPVCQALVSPGFKPPAADRSLVKQEEFYRPASTDAPTETSDTSALTSVSPLMTSASDRELYLDEPPDASGPERGQGLSWEDRSGNKLLSAGSELDCSPESLHSQLAEPTLTSGQVSGSHNTTFISSGQVMNFSGDVIVVYVSQTSVGSDGAGQEDAFGSPVQEEASAAVPFFQSALGSRGDSISHASAQNQTLPVQEAMEARPLGK